jgi:hypothetical protein
MAPAYNSAMSSKQPLLAFAAAVLLAPAVALSQQASQAPSTAEKPAAAPTDSPAAAAEARPRTPTLPWARIEQVRRGNRVVEVRVSDGAGEHRYTMVNREGRPPLSSQELSSGLSTPRFFNFEF